MKMKLTNGQEVEMKINFKSLLELKNREPDAFEKGNHVIMDGTREVDDIVGGLYAAYVCANKNHLTYEEFLEVLPFDLKEITKTFNGLYMQDVKK